MSVRDRLTKFVGAMLLTVPIAAIAQEKLTVRLDFSPWGIQAAMHLAQEKGWFKQAGLDVDVQDGRGSGSTLQLVNAGQADVGQVQLGLLPQARENGASVTSIACWDRRTDLGVAVDRSSPITKVSDFENKTLAVFPASPWVPLIDYWLSKGNLDRNKVHIMSVDASALWGIYTAKRADGLMSTEPSAVPMAESLRPSKMILAEDVGISFPGYGLIVNARTLSTKRAALQSLVTVERRAWEYIRQGHADEAADAVIKQRPDAKLSKTILTAQITHTLAFFDTPATAGKPVGWQADADWQKTLETMQNAKVIKAGWKTSDYYTNEFIK